MPNYAPVRSTLTIRTLLLLCGLLAAPQIHADYLSDLEAEAKNLENPSGSPAKDDASNWSMKELEISNSLQPNLEQPQFELQLKNSFIGSYTVYSRLNDAQKGLVYAAYKDGVAVEELNRLIRELYNKL